MHLAQSKALWLNEAICVRCSSQVNCCICSANYSLVCFFNQRSTLSLLTLHTYTRSSARAPNKSIVLLENECGMINKGWLGSSNGFAYYLIEFLIAPTSLLRGSCIINGHATLLSWRAYKVDFARRAEFATRALFIGRKPPSALMLKDQHLMRLRDLNPHAHQSRLGRRNFINYN